MEHSKSIDKVSCKVLNPGVHGLVRTGCIYEFKLFKNKEMFKKGLVQEAWTSRNLVTSQGKDLTNNVMFGATSKVSTWYLLLFYTDTTPLVTHTYAVPGFTESTLYDEATRPEFVDAPSNSNVISNVASPAIFTMNGTTTIYGCALVGGGSAASTKGNTDGGGYLYSSSKFSVPKEVIATNILSVDISITQS